MGDERSYAHHLRLKVPQKKQILHKAVRGLPGRADHESGPGLIAACLE